MTQPPESDDTAWFDALADKPAGTADPKGNQQASALRAALLKRSEALDSNVPEADAAQYQQLQFRLRREGLAQQRPIWQSTRIWAMAASVVVGIALVVQMSGLLPERDEGMVMRGGGQATVLVVNDPEARLAELQQGLRMAKAEPKVERLGGGKIQLTLKATTEALDYLATQRIEPAVKEGRIMLLLSPQPAKP